MKKNYSLDLFSGLLACGLVSIQPTTYAAAPDAGQVLREQQQLRPSATQANQLTESTPKRPAAHYPNNTQVHVRSIHFTGADGLVAEQTLEAQVKGLIGKTVGFGELQQATENITQYLKNQGWILASAYLPKQDVTDGHIEIAIVRGHIQGGKQGDGLKIIAENPKLEKRIRRTLANALQTDKNADLNNQRLERGLLLLNDLPATNARASLESGHTPGETELQISAKKGPRVSANTWADNYGNYYTGSGRLNAQASANNPLFPGDQFNVTATGAKGLALGQLGYSLPIGYQGLRAHLNYTVLHYEIGKELSNLDSKGDAQTKGAQLSYPIVRSRAKNLWTKIGYDHKTLRDESLNATLHDKRLNNITTSLQGDAYDQWHGGGLFNFSLGLTQGKLDLSRNTSDLTSDQSSAYTNGSFTKYTYSLARLQTLNSQLSLFAAINGQNTRKNLDSSEKFTLGGPGGVRAYPVGEASGDKGWVSNLELRYDVNKQALGAHPQLVAFLDIGNITLNKTPWGAAPSATGFNHYQLRGAGLGLNLTKAASYEIRAAVATRIGNNPGRSLQNQDADGHASTYRIWLQGMVWL